MPFNYSIPELESKDEMFWHLFKAFRFLEQKDYSIRRFSINNDCISIDYFKKGWSINVSTSIPFDGVMIVDVNGNIVPEGKVISFANLTNFCIIFNLKTGCTFLYSLFCIYIDTENNPC